MYRLRLRLRLSIRLSHRRRRYPHLSPSINPRLRLNLRLTLTRPVLRKYLRMKLYKSPPSPQPIYLVKTSSDGLLLIHTPQAVGDRTWPRRGHNLRRSQVARPPICAGAHVEVHGEIPATRER